MNQKRHIVTKVLPFSIGEELEIQAGDELISINNQLIEDIFDYHYLINDTNLIVIIRKPDGEEWELEIEKDYEEDLGISFDEGLMDQYRSCRNKCVFCFIDQNPPGMRETIYFKDDDARLSFLQGNYITLTNMKDSDIERIIKYKLSPINISVHTTNPTLRRQMLNNRFAGEALEKMKRLYEGQITMNSQIVLCRGLNDGAELDRTIQDLAEFIPYMQSICIVPLGKTKFRDGLARLDKFDQESSREVLTQIHRWQDKFLTEHGTRFIFASDEWYLTAGYEVPEDEYYEGYEHIEDGIGMVRNLTTEVEDYLSSLASDDRSHKVSLVTGLLAYPIIKELTKKVTAKFANISATVYPIVNEFYGEEITVTGLLTGQDIIKQLKEKDLGDYLILPGVLLRSGEDVLLDDYTITDIEKALQTPIRIVKSDGTSFVDTIIKDANTGGTKNE